MLILADARAIPLASSSVQMVMTSPPYWGLRDYGVGDQIGLEATPDEYVAQLVTVFREIKRVLREDGTVWLNLGDSYCNAGSRNNGSGLDGKRRGGMEGSDGTWADSRDKYGDKRHALKAFGIKHKDLIGIPWRVAFALQADGWYLRSDIIWHKPNPMPESVTDSWHWWAWCATGCVETVLRASPAWVSPTSYSCCNVRGRALKTAPARFVTA